MFGLGMGELLIILVIVLLVFGAGKLPQIGDALGRSIKNFKSAASHENEIEVSKKKEISASDEADLEDVAAKTTEKKTSTTR
jgi:sec-independent protein translocase protein TatA